MKSLKLLAIALLTTVLFSSCISVTSKVSRHKTEVSKLNTQTTMKDFDGICVAGSMNVVLIQGNSPSVEVKGNNKETFDQLVIYVKNNTLNIESKNKSKIFGFMGSNSFDGITVYVTTPNIESIELAGSGNITANQTINANNVHLEIAGSGDIEFKDNFSCNRMTATVAGSGNITFDQIKAEKISTTIAGSGNVTYNNMDVNSVDSEIAGSGNIILKGKVAQHTESVAGSGKVDLSGI